MDIIQKSLDILFRRIPPERILDVLQKSTNGLRMQSPLISQKLFLRYADIEHGGYSEDEQVQLYRYIEDLIVSRARELRVFPSVFLLLIDFGQEVLTNKGEQPLCKSNQVKRWREMYHLLGQDLFVCAYLAYCDVASSTKRTCFTWPATIKTDNTVLDKMLDEGLAENHYHLNGSTQSFSLSWCKLMNYPDEVQEWIKGFPVLLQTVVGRGPEDNVLPINERIMLACMIRTILFKAIHASDFCDCREKFDCLKEFHKGMIERFNNVSYAIKATDLLRLSYGAKIPLPDGTTACMDYALDSCVFSTSSDSPFRILAGERHFLYQCFIACFSGEFGEIEQKLLYFYLLVKSSFRGEMIQVNKQVGFQNFSNYERRKDLIWENDPYWWEAYRIAINAPIKVGAVRSLEARFCPTLTKEQLYERVRKYDKAKWFADQPFFTSLNNHNQLIESKVISDKGHNDEPHFYVLHYPKQKDDDFDKLPSFCLRCRHEDLRDDVKKRTIATVEALSKDSYLCSRIRGIDGCANEVLCRPEVFANAFRYIRNVDLSSNAKVLSLLSAPVSRISATYHAGEDFYDIVDGLRAIDESILFLELARGDRIGHALALGVDPQTHYHLKLNSVVIPKQNYLDNLVWLLYRARELNVEINSHQYGIMKQEALHLLREIYGDAIYKHQWNVTLQEYYYSMKLRGDDPSLYKTTTYKPKVFFGCNYDRYQISQKHIELLALRQDDTITGLYYYYQYGHKEKIEGAKPIIVPIKYEYIDLVRKIQDAMQIMIEEKGIIVECNPTSNVLIGTFGDYAKHPIFRFYSIKSKEDKEGDGSSIQMHVCINTDDLGVFDTSLEFEYALLYSALKEQCDVNGNPKYSSVEIIQYLDDIRKMGLQAIFPKNN